MMATNSKYVMLKDRMEQLELPLMGLGVWAFGVGSAGFAIGGPVFGLVGFVVGAAIGFYSVFFDSRLATILRVPAVMIALGLCVFFAGMSFLYGGH
ncbi:hypothetical protein ABIB57_001025 [Devosia sp. UYZn731]|uniref:hypothetical protein n=1 Tax=Devosia sp. UYZn731 TaxID=3156345 RepID=UPI00339B0BD0